MRTVMSKQKIPNDGRRWLLGVPDVFGLVLTAPEFIKASDLGDAVVQTGAPAVSPGLTCSRTIRWARILDLSPGIPTGAAV